MANDPDHFVTSTSADQTYVEMGKIHSAQAKGLTVTSIAKVFTYKGSTLQVIVHITNLPIHMAKQRLTQTIRKYAQNIVAQQNNKRRAVSAQGEE